VPATPAPATLLAIGEAPAAAMGMTYLATAASLGLAMENATAAQQRGQVIGEAALVQVLAMIIAKGAS
jgi:hypothetical protein